MQLQQVNITNNKMKTLSYTLISFTLFAVASLSLAAPIRVASTLPQQHILLTAVMPQYFGNINRISSGYIGDYQLLPPTINDIWQLFAADAADIAVIRHSDYPERFRTTTMTLIASVAADAASVSYALWSIYQRYFKLTTAYGNTTVLALVAGEPMLLYSKQPIFTTKDVQLITSNQSVALGLANSGFTSTLVASKELLTLFGTADMNTLFLDYSSAQLDGFNQQYSSYSAEYFPRQTYAILANNTFIQRLHPQDSEVLRSIPGSVFSAFAGATLAAQQHKQQRRATTSAAALPQALASPLTAAMQHLYISTIMNLALPSEKQDALIADFMKIIKKYRPQSSKKLSSWLK